MESEIQAESLLGHLRKVKDARRRDGRIYPLAGFLGMMGVRGKHRNVFYALGYNGHGVTLANLAGEVLTDLYSGDDEKWRDLPFYQQLQ